MSFLLFLCRRNSKNNRKNLLLRAALSSYSSDKKYKLSSQPIKKLVYENELSYKSIQTDVQSTKRSCIIIGAGHNGLTAAAYLAKAGVDVTVLERRDVIR